MRRQWGSNTCTDAEGRGCWYEWWWVVSRDGSSMSVQCVLRVFKWVKSQLWLPDGGRFDPDHSDRPGLWCAAAYYWHYRETGIFLPNHFQIVLACTGCPLQDCVRVCKCVSMCECVLFFRCRTRPVTSTTCLRVFGCADVLLSRVKWVVKFAVLKPRPGACLRLCSGRILIWFWVTFHHKLWVF